MTDFTNPGGLLFLAVLIPVIILYLLRPKPKDMRIPSLMFIIGMEQRRRFRSFFKRILRDPLLVLQLLALSLIVLALAGPFSLSTETHKVTEDAVIILDMSASMQAGSPTRFEQAKGAALSVLADLDESDKVSVILAENIPIIALKRGSAEDAKSLIGGSYPKATTSGIGGAILLGADLIKESNIEKMIYVVSDFSNYEGSDPLAAQKTAFAQGIGVKLIRVGSPEENVAIIASRSGRSQEGCFMEIVAKNYGSAEKTVTAELFIDSQWGDSESKALPPGSAGVFSLSVKCSGVEHEAMTSLSVSDAMTVDNRAYAIIPKTLETDVLLIREEDSGNYIKYALESLEGVYVDEIDPPVYPEDYSSYDLVVFQNAEGRNILAGTFRALEKFVETGGDLVIFGFEGLLEVPASELGTTIPVVPIEVSNFGGSPSKLFDHQLLTDVDIESVRAEKYLYVDAKLGSVILSDIAGNSVLSIAEFGAGQIVYIGLYPQSNWSDFQLKPSFPIFWSNMVGWLSEGRSMGDSRNFKTGDQMPVGLNQTNRVKKPSGEVIEGANIIMDDAGFYLIEKNGFTAAASLLDEKESNVSSSNLGESSISDGYKSERFDEEVKHEWFWGLAIAGLIVVIVEWFYYKRRGSL